MSTGLANRVIESVRISDVYHALTGNPARRSGRDRFRCPATWRGGDGLTVSLDDAKGVWHDPKADEGGGVLDLVSRVRGEDRQDALRWLANFAGVTLDESPLSAEGKASWAAERRAVERDLPAARLWRRAAVGMGEDTLCDLKSALFDPNEPQPCLGEIAEWTRRLELWRRLDGAALVEAYQAHLARDPQLTGGMTRYARDLETAEVRAVIEFVRQIEEAEA